MPGAEAHNFRETVENGGFAGVQAQAADLGSEPQNSVGNHHRIPNRLPQIKPPLFPEIFQSFDQIVYYYKKNN